MTAQDVLWGVFIGFTMFFSIVGIATCLDLVRDIRDYRKHEKAVHRERDSL